MMVGGDQAVLSSAGHSPTAASGARNHQSLVRRELQAEELAHQSVLEQGLLPASGGLVELIKQ